MRHGRPVVCRACAAQKNSTGRYRWWMRRGRSAAPARSRASLAAAAPSPASRSDPTVRPPRTPALPSQMPGRSVSCDPAQPASSGGAELRRPFMRPVESDHLVRDVVSRQEREVAPEPFAEPLITNTRADQDRGPARCRATGSVCVRTSGGMSPPSAITAAAGWRPSRAARYAIDAPCEKPANTTGAPPCRRDRSPGRHIRCCRRSPVRDPRASSSSRRPSGGRAYRNGAAPEARRRASARCPESIARRRTRRRPIVRSRAERR